MAHIKLFPFSQYIVYFNSLNCEKLSFRDSQWWSSNCQWLNIYDWWFIIFEVRDQNAQNNSYKLKISMEKKRELTPVIYRYIWFPCTEECHWKKSDQKDILFCVNCVCICVYIGGKENVSLFRLTASQRDSKDWQDRKSVV